MTALTERKFVIFDAAQIDVNSVVALAYQLQEVRSLDKEGKPITVQVQVAKVVLDNGSSITLGDSSLEKFEHWWKENVEAEKVILPDEPVINVVEPVAEVPAPPASVAPSLPTPTPVVPTPSSAETSTPVQPTTPETPAPTQAPPSK